MKIHSDFTSSWEVAVDMDTALRLTMRWWSAYLLEVRSIRSQFSNGNDDLHVMVPGNLATSEVEEVA